MRKTQGSQQDVAPVVPEGVGEDHIAIRLEAGPRHAGFRLDRFLIDRIPRLSRTKAQAIVRSSAFSAGGTPLRPNHRVAAGETVFIYRPRPDEPDTPQSFSVIHEDAAMIVIDKPAGLPVHPSARYHRNTLTSILRERYGNEKPVPVHRLDRETSGLMILARTLEAERRLKRMFAERKVEKTYLAITAGTPDPANGVIDAPLGPAVGSDVRIKMGLRRDSLGLEAVTEYRTRSSGSVEVNGRSLDLALVEALPRTGRQHQVRAHLALAGAPVLGDKIYGPDESLFLEYLETGLTPSLIDRLILPRHALHAWRASFAHPIHGRAMTLECPLPSDLASLVPRSGL